MQQNLLIIFIFIVLVSLIAGLLAAKKESNNSQITNESFFLGNRSLSSPMLFITLLGTQVGGGFILGASDACASIGLLGATYNIGISIGMLLLGLKIANHLRRIHINTMSDIFQIRYNSPRLKALSGIFSILSMGGILIALAIGLRKFLFSIGITDQWMFLFIWLTIIGYTTHGGFLAVVWTDCVQAIGMVVILVISFLWVVIPNIDKVITTALETPILLKDIPFNALLTPILFTIIAQDIAQRTFAAKSEKDATKACYATSITLLILTLIPASFGLLAKNMGISAQDGSTFISVAKTHAPEWIFFGAASAVLLATLSTTSSILLAISSNAIQDIPLFSHISPKKMTFWIGIVSALISCIGTDIISWIVKSYEISVYTLFVPFMFGLFSKKECHEKSALFAIIGGGVLFLTTPIWSHFSSNGLFQALIPLLGSFFGYTTYDFISNKKKLSP